ncbi:MAG: hypothetical protein LUQ26_08985 [Methylococcaceae bacterium]|nr:hypothetical protein [Methylococcaceae bacterium]
MNDISRYFRIGYERIQNAGCPLVATGNFLKKWATNGVITKLYCAANDVQYQAQYSYRPSLAKGYALPHFSNT